MGSTQEHTKLVNDILLALGTRRELGFWWRNPTGAIEGEDGRYQRYGLPGSPDIVGLLANGTFCGLEAKTGNATFQKNQKIFKSIVETNKGIVIKAVSLAQVLAELERLNAIAS